ncbi:protein required for attachment to host cells [Terrimicrobium sacchariphilum]|jgi:hypothetical protein|uniref:Protein required for attachment to host cells n=1 Tax=Terrimicrobium sacchariphilum TaxID=690879 RepID=A0A146GDI6_TERSA|nr:host attachment protein [Terrimicrobium sacchariphilum]GAT34556.1 protein required for attachment to host cells [Terrimicrobium sacchariphilum]
MNASFLYIADRGGLKIYRVEDHVPRLLEFFPVDDAKGRWRDHLTDKAGGFPAGKTAGHGNSTAERLRLEAETDMRCLRKIATRLCESLDEHIDVGWSFAAPSELNGAILDGLPDRYRSRLVQSLRADLLNTTEDELATHFDLHAVPNH